MRVLYIGQYTDGTTSKMRADHIKRILNAETFDVIDTHIPFYSTSRILRSFGFRYKRGPLINNINGYINKHFKNKKYDLIWFDKAIFIKPSLVGKLKRYSNKLVHFTPDMAFYENRSPHFIKSMIIFDFVITTKKAEVDIYKKYISKERLIVTSQGFSKDEHFPLVDFAKKENTVAFIGLAEKSRFELIEYFINNKINCKVAGMGWKEFAKKHSSNPYFTYLGSGIYGKDYSKFISSSKFGLGLLSKRIPELHTTRTFEIPACGTALITERNSEISSFYKENEVIFFSSPEKLVEKIQYYLSNDEELKILTERGYKRVSSDGRNYSSILNNLLEEIL